MSNRNNDVFSVLVLDKTTPIINYDSTPGSENFIVSGQPGYIPLDQATFLPGQLGVFHSGSLKGQCVLAVGVDKNNDGIVDDIITQAGPYIPVREVNYTSKRNYQAPAGEMFWVDINPAVTVREENRQAFEGDYAVRMEFQNPRISRLIGRLQYAETYFAGDLCTDFASITYKAGDGASIYDKKSLILLGLLRNINCNKNSLFTAYLGLKTVDSNGDITTVEIDPHDESIAGTFPRIQDVYSSGQTNSRLGIILKANPLKIASYCNINMHYYNHRNTKIIPTVVGDTNCKSFVELVRSGLYEKGSGYDVRDREYMAGGWNGNTGPYRQTTVTGLARDIFYQADIKEKYTQVTIQYTLHSNSGWLEYQNPCTTEVYFPKERDKEAQVFLDLQGLGILFLSETDINTGSDLSVDKIAVDPNIVSITGSFATLSLPAGNMYTITMVSGATAGTYKLFMAVDNGTPIQVGPQLNHAAGGTEAFPPVRVYSTYSKVVFSVTT